MTTSGTRLAVFAVLLASMVTVLLGRTVQLQAADTGQFQQAAASNTVRTLVDPAARGLIVDQAGRPLAANRQVLQVVIDRAALYELPQDGAAVVNRLAALLGTSFAAIDAKLTFCGTPDAIAGQCWQGSAYDPIPVATDIPMELALPILEQSDGFPGVSIATVTVRSYPSSAGERAGQVLGHLGAVTTEELTAANSEGGFRPDDLVGRGGLEQQYDAALRGQDGSRTVAVDTAGRVTRRMGNQQPVSGSTVISSIDARLQAVVEQQLAAAVDRARAAGGGLAADSGSAVVIDVTNGNVLAMASYPDFAPSIWDGGISAADYRALADSGALLLNPVQGTYPPGSTFKPFTVAAMAAAGFNLNSQYACPGSYLAGGRQFANHESRGYGTISLARALEVSCNTVFYRAADQLWESTGGEQAPAGGADPIHAAAVAFGLGQRTGIDLPGEVAGLVAGRQTMADQWRANQAKWCEAAAAGYPELRRTNPALADQYTALDQENCDSGGSWRQGDAINAGIGQGLTAVTPLQLAMAYAAIGNGGTRYQPRVAKAVVGSDGAVTKLDPVVTSQVPINAETLRFLTKSMAGVTSQGTAANAFAGFPLDQIPVAGKTGSAQVSGGKPATSWFASFAPADEPRYAVVMMVTQGGTGAQTSAPSVRAIYEAIFGIAGGTADPGRSIFAGGAPAAGLPAVNGVTPAPASAEGTAQ